MSTEREGEGGREEEREEEKKRGREKECNGLEYFPHGSECYTT